MNNLRLCKLCGCEITTEDIEEEETVEDAEFGTVHKECFGDDRRFER